MSVFNDIWRQLVRRRLLPVALLLLAALAAVPVLLAKHPDAAPQTPTGGATAASPGLDEGVVALASNDGEGRRRRVLGAPKDPFKPAPLPKVKAARKTDGPSTPAQSGAGAGGAAPSGSGSQATPISLPAGGGGAPAVEAPAGGRPGAPRKSYALYSISVRFGESSAEQLQAGTVKRLEALPSADEPVLIYLGVEDGGKTAVFLLDSGVSAQGDGTCKPDGHDCETIHLHEGDTEFLDVPGTGDASAPAKQFELDLVKIHRGTTASAAKAARARASSSAAGRKILRARVAAAPLRYRYDAATGTVRNLGGRAYRAAVARAARAHS